LGKTIAFKGVCVPPIDDTPHAGEIMQPPERRIPQPQPGQESDEPVRGNPEADEAEDEPDIAHRPELPEHPAQMMVDSENEDAPVIDSGPGIDDGVKSLKKQRG
jgi:hypothetical protein